MALGAPAYVAYAAPDLAGYLLHPGIVAVEVLPYLLCAVLWLPWRAPDVRRVAVLLSALLLLGTGIVHAPMLWEPGRRGGDMIGLAFVAISLGLTSALLIGSGVAVLWLWYRRRTEPGQSLPRTSPGGEGSRQEGMWRGRPR